MINITYYFLIGFTIGCLPLGVFGAAFWAALASIAFARGLGSVACSVWLLVCILVLEAIRGGIV